MANTITLPFNFHLWLTHFWTISIDGQKEKKSTNEVELQIGKHVVDQVIENCSFHSLVTANHFGSFHWDESLILTKDHFLPIEILIMARLNLLDHGALERHAWIS